MNWKEIAESLGGKTEEQINTQKEKFTLRHELHKTIEKICSEFAKNLKGSCETRSLDKENSKYEIIVSSFKIAWEAKRYCKVEISVFYKSSMAVEIMTERCSDSFKLKCPIRKFNIDHRGVRYYHTTTGVGYWKSGGIYSGIARCKIPFDKFTEKVFAEVLAEFCEETMSPGSNGYFKE